MSNTPFFNLLKLLKADPYDIAQFNSNMDIIDTEMHKPPLTVNEIQPDPVTRDIQITTVPLADNLTSDEAQINTGTFVIRATGGDASISDGSAWLSEIKGNQVKTGYAAESLNMTVNAVQRTAPAAITATLNKTTFEAYVESAGTYTLTYGLVWSADPSLYGVTVSNEPMNGDKITIVWDGTNDPVMTVDAVTRLAPDPITATIDRGTFVSYVTNSGTVTLNYTTAWSANPALYGITVSNTPVNGDQIVVVYVKENRGTISVASPTSFVSTGWNLYNHSAGYARVMNYSSDYGFMIDGTYTALKFAETLTGTQTTITPVNGYFTVPSDGYVFVTGGNATDTEIWMTWIDWTDEANGGVFEAYTQDVIDLSGVMVNFPYGLMRVGNVFDEINLNTGKAYSRVQRLQYSEENLAGVIASGVEYDTDTNYIYAEMSTPAVYNINLDGEYSVDDHGMEMFIGTSIPVTATALYGNDLKGKLRRDVLTISQQELTTNQKTQVLNNLGIASKVWNPSGGETLLAYILAQVNRSGLPFSAIKVGSTTISDTPYTTEEFTILAYGSGDRIAVEIQPYGSTGKTWYRSIWQNAWQSSGNWESPINDLQSKMGNSDIGYNNVSNLNSVPVFTAGIIYFRYDSSATNKPSSYGGAGIYIASWAYGVQIAYVNSTQNPGLYARTVSGLDSTVSFGSWKTFSFS